VVFTTKTFTKALYLNAHYLPISSFSIDKNQKKHATNITATDFLELLSSDELLSIVEDNIPEYREQVQTPKITLLKFYFFRWLPKDSP